MGPLLPGELITLTQTVMVVPMADGSVQYVPVDLPQTSNNKENVQQQGECAATDEHNQPRNSCIALHPCIRRQDA